MPPRSHRSLPSSRPLGRAWSSLVAAATLAAPRGAVSQVAAAVQGIADVEMWKTDSGSVLLTRNDGRAGGVARLHLWGAAQLGEHLVVYAAGTGESGNARSERGTEWYTDLAGVRYTRSEAFVLDVGKMPHPVGAFASRRYSVRNPLIGTPDGYPVEYPLGAQISGARGRVDYRAAVVSLPVYHEDYVPDPSRAPRPALGAGFTPTTGVRVGVSGTWGPYLDRDLPNTLLGGRSWRTYHERVTSVDAQASRGYLELRGELAATSYDVPGNASASSATRVVRGLTYYGEAKYTLAPRVFVAGRLERNDYAFIKPASSTAWIATPTDMYDGEAGVGYRADARTLLKASVRADRWNVAPALRSTLPNGVAIAFQLSRAFDVVDVSAGSR